MSSWFSSVLGAVGQARVTHGDAASGEADAEAQPPAAPPAGDAEPGAGFHDRVTYWTNAAVSAGAALAKESGFALVDRVKEGGSVPAGDAAKESAEIEASCKAISTGVAEPPAIWKRWAARMDASPPECFYDGKAHEDVSLRTLLLRSSALDVAVCTVLRKPSFASDEDQSLLDFLDHMFIGERAGKAQVVNELAKLAEVVDGTASLDRIRELVLAALHEARRDHRYEEALRECTDLLEHSSAREKELRMRPRRENASAGAAGAACEAAEDDGGGELPVVGTEMGDEEVRERVMRSSELLDSNASLRHLVTVGGALLQARAERGTCAENAMQELAALRRSVNEHKTCVKSRIAGATEERTVVAQEAQEEEERLGKTAGTLSRQLDDLVCKRRQLEAELEVVMGEILSTEQQLTETQRGLERLPRQRDSKDKNLQDQLQALGVQVQDAENEMDALDETKSFVQKVSAFVCGAVEQQTEEMGERRRRIQTDEHKFILLHLQHQAAQLVLLRDTLQFCTEELAQTETKTTKISKLGMPELVSEEGTRASMLQRKRHEAAARVLAIRQDVQDLTSQASELSRATPRAAAADSSVAADGGGAETAPLTQTPVAAIKALLAQLEADLVALARTFQLEGDLEQGGDAAAGSCAASDTCAERAAPAFSPLPPRPPLSEELLEQSAPQEEPQQQGAPRVLAFEDDADEVA